jgi:hypothetical protein
MAINVTQAVNAAVHYTQSFPDLMKVYDLRLEETRLNQATNSWFITLSYTTSPIVGSVRQNKEFSIDENGNVISMKNK